ncbi:MAG: hypothetical protein ACE5JO_02245 [Candidatus Binatia bacterium]
MNFEFAGFIIGVVGAIWLKVSMRLFNQEREKPEIEKLRPRLENPALEAFIRGLSLVLIGLGMETFARLFLN